MLVRKSHEDATKRSFNKKTIQGSHALVRCKRFSIFFSYGLEEIYFDQRQFFSNRLIFFIFLNLIFKPSLA